MLKTYTRVFAKPQMFNGVLFRSTIESDFAKFLSGVPFSYKKAGFYHTPVKWEYEQHEFELIPQEQWIDKTERDLRVKKARHKKHSLHRVIYTPDFYLPEYDLYVEVKGRQFDDELFRLRYRLFKHRYPDKAIWLLTSHEQFDKLDEILENLKI